MQRYLIVLVCLTSIVSGCHRNEPSRSSVTEGDLQNANVAAKTPSAEWWSSGTSNSAPDLKHVLSDKSAWTLDNTTYDLHTDPAANQTHTFISTRQGKTLTITGRTHYPAGIQVRALVRMRTGNAPSCFATLSVANRKTSDGQDASLSLMLSRVAKDNGISCSVSQAPNPFFNLKAMVEASDWPELQLAQKLSYQLRAYPQLNPGWEEEFRARVEEAMSFLPDADQKWLDLRVELNKSLVKFWVDDRLVAWKREEGLDPEGTVNLTLSGGVELASLRIESTQATPGFQPIRLGGYVNASNLGSARVAPTSLPPADQVVNVEGVPFTFPGMTPEGFDHIDVGQSYLRQANVPGYLPAMYGNLVRWRGAAERDPGRIQIRIPNGQFDTLYLIAASDDDKDEIPLVTAMFYRPGAGYPVCYEATVPRAMDSHVGDHTLPVKLTNGKDAKLWLIKIPLDPGQLSSFADMDHIEIELTKKVYPYRSYPDPINYSYHQGGRPSSVHVYAATLGRVPVGFEWNPDTFGHVWTAPADAAYTASITNHTNAAQVGKLLVLTRSYDGTEETRQEKDITLVPRDPAKPAISQKFAVAVPVKLFGYHDITATLTLGGRTWTEKRSFVKLAPDTRSVTWTKGKGAMFGYWSYHGGHHTPKSEHHTRLMTIAGARAAEHPPTPVTDLMLKHWGHIQSTAYYVSPQPWAADDVHKPEDITKFHQEIEKAFVTWEKDLLDQFKPDVVNYFTESHISPRLTAGTWPEYFGDPPFVYTDEEKKRTRMLFETARIASEYLRKAHPDRDLLIGWGDPGMSIPLLRAGFPKNLIDGASLDVPNFERLPEMQLKDNAVHRLYMLVQEFKKYGMEKPRLQVCEGAFVPTEPGAVSYREQMDIYTRWNLIDTAYGVDRFYAGWFAFDCGNYYGSEHYGGCGIQRRIPYCDPKPAYASFATMTDRLNEANFDGWIPTGSLSTYCLRFKHETRGYVYTLWTLRGKRPATLVFDGKLPKSIVDSMNNPVPQGTSNRSSNEVVITTDPSVIYVTTDATSPLKEIRLGDPDNSDAQPGRLTFGTPNNSREPAAKPAQITQIADMGDGSWKFTNERDVLYENNHWGFYPAAGKFSASVVNDSNKGKVLASKLEKQERTRELMPWYNVLRPKKPIVITGAPDRLGLWVKGDSSWGRTIYVLRDDKGERWINIGAKDDYNCDDTHSWSAFNFDGWRYLRFELPGHEGYDNYRKFGTTWWRSGAPLGVGTSGIEGEELVRIPIEPGDHIVDLPLSLEAIIVEQRTHILYVNDVQPVKSDTVLLGKIFAEYDEITDTTKESLRISKLRMPAPKEALNLPNPIAEASSTGTLPGVKLLRLTAPEHQYDGTRMHIHFEPSEVNDGTDPAKTKYFVWVGGHSDGRGSVNITPNGVKSGDLIYGLRPGVKLYYWIIYSNGSNTSKPSNMLEVVTIDNFKEK